MLFLNQPYSVKITLVIASTLIILAIAVYGTFIMIKETTPPQNRLEDLVTTTPTTPESTPLDPELVAHIQSKSNLMRLTSPLPLESITSPLVITGEARGNWFFEASFPVVLVDWDGRIIAQTIATAQKEWMTEDFVPFVATITFEKPSYGERGSLILQKDNPSGLSRFDDALEIPIFFK